MKLSPEKKQGRKRCERRRRNFKRGGTSNAVPGLPQVSGVEVEAEVKCSCGGWSETVKLSDEVQASGMEELS